MLPRTPIKKAAGGNQTALVETYIGNFNQTKNKKLPPYGKTVQELLLNGKKPTNSIFCFCGIDTWKKATAFSKSQLCLCLPPGENPFNFYWPVNDCDVLLFETGGLKIFDVEKLIYCLLCAGATVVRVIPFDCGKLLVFRKGANK